ncbi:hypothetical protein EIP91_011478 [Steccherinum ochraceum]|uniref:DUF6589 domain-containing protein n=1 Tax=Steccherinum ochraceum TaxID=92696 RepID=A0A4R0R1S7_9APHY|nr:hypothetical protein EIP91_011478 [Steccherinum ochraceum]
MNRESVASVLQALGTQSLTSFIIQLVCDPALASSPTRVLFLNEWSAFLAYAATLPALSVGTSSAFTTLYTKKLKSEVAELANKESGWHFSARNASEEQVDNFMVEDMAGRLEAKAPTLWILLGELLESDSALARRRAHHLAPSAQPPEPAAEWDEEAEFWANDMLLEPVEREDVEGTSGPRPSKRQRRAAERTLSLLRIRRVIIMSILMLSTNQKCNPVAAMIGFFLHSTSAPELVIEVLAHAGLSTSPTAIHSMVNSLSEKSAKRIREIAKTKTAAFAYDNFDMDFKSWSSTMDRPGTTLQHLTSALIFPLEHEAQPADLKFADELWDTDPINPGLSDEQRKSLRKPNYTDFIPRRVPSTAASAIPAPPPSPAPPAPNHADSITGSDSQTSSGANPNGPSSPSFAPPEAHASDESNQGHGNSTASSSTPAAVDEPGLKLRIIAWHFRHALVTFCESFKQFKPHLGAPETMLQIPVKKTTHVPCRAMDINQSTADGQAQIIENLFTQANIGDPTEKASVEDIGDHVVFMHGDLGTGERLESIRRSRSIESTKLRRLQAIIFVLGLFHLQMALAEAIYRMYIQPKHLHSDVHSLYEHACRVHPHETGKIGSKPGFRLVHDIIHQCGYARLLDVWETHMRKLNTAHATLDDFAASQPSWPQIVKLSIELAQTYVDKPRAEDTLFRNNSLILARLLLYMELTHALKHGDIGRVEFTFLDCIFIFKAVGKHKYAAALLNVMHLLKFRLPPRLARIFRMNWLCNPTGRPDGFRPVDWLVELMNLYTKVVYPGIGFTRTIQLVLKQSPLIETFRRVHRIMQDNFHLIHRTVRHAPPDLRSTLSVLRGLLRASKAHVLVQDRVIPSTTVPLKDHFREGMYMAATQKSKVTATKKGKSGKDNSEGDDDEEDDDDGIDSELTVDDLEA